MCRQWKYEDDPNYWEHIGAGLALEEAGSFLVNFDWFWNGDVVGSYNNDCVVPYGNQRMVNFNQTYSAFHLSHTEEKAEHGAGMIMYALQAVTCH